MTEDNNREVSRAPRPDVKTKPNIALIAGLVMVALSVIFFLQNSEKVPIDFLVFEKITTIRWSILMAVVLGVLLDRMFTIWWRRRRRKNNRNDD
ncbi:MAG: hypothetical protein Q7V57_09625 [Actinomycetota bacterium]|nr:hypothetical protein [Actinomycetota bacterium]